jgi:hypothetical protein
MLQQLEKQVQEGFVDGIPPHLQTSTGSLRYTAKSDQSCFFIAPHLEYINLSPQIILGVLCERHIIVHSHPFDHQYGWNFDSFACLYNVDKLTMVHGEANFILIIILLTAMLEAAPYMHPSRPDTQHFQGTLCDLFEITTTFPVHCIP